MEVLPFIWVIVIMIQECYLQPAFYLLSELFVETLHVHLVLLYVREAPFVDEEFADAVRATLLF
jgi:hypothetical protein